MQQYGYRSREKKETVKVRREKKQDARAKLLLQVDEESAIHEKT